MPVGFRCRPLWCPEPPWQRELGCAPRVPVLLPGWIEPGLSPDFSAGAPSGTGGPRGDLLAGWDSDTWLLGRCPDAIAVTERCLERFPSWDPTATGACGHATGRDRATGTLSRDGMSRNTEQLHQGSHPGILGSCWGWNRAAPASPGLPVPYKLKIKVNYSHGTSKSLSTGH